MVQHQNPFCGWLVNEERAPEHQFRMPLFWESTDCFPEGETTIRTTQQRSMSGCMHVLAHRLIASADAGDGVFQRVRVDRFGTVDTLLERNGRTSANKSCRHSCVMEWHRLDCTLFVLYRCTANQHVRAKLSGTSSYQIVSRLSIGRIVYECFVTSTEDTSHTI